MKVQVKWHMYYNGKHDWFQKADFRTHISDL
jgi:hypothetical protein